MKQTIKNVWGMAKQNTWLTQSDQHRACAARIVSPRQLGNAENPPKPGLLLGERGPGLDFLPERILFSPCWDLSRATKASHSQASAPLQKWSRKCSSSNISFWVSAYRLPRSFQLYTFSLRLSAREEMMMSVGRNSTSKKWRRNCCWCMNPC